MRTIHLTLAAALLAVACQNPADKGDKKATADAKGAKDQKAEKGDDEVARPDDDKAAAPTRDADVLLAGMKAFSAGDLDGCLSMFADDVEWHEIGREPIKGKEAIKAMWAQMSQQITGLKVVPDRIIDGGDVVAVTYVSNGTAKANPAGGPAADTPVGVHELLIAEMRDGKVAKMTLVADQAAFMAQVGMVKDMPAPPVPPLPTGEPEVIEGEANAATVEAAKGWYIAFAKNTYAEAAKAAMAEGVIGHDLAMGKDMNGLAENLKMLEGFFAAFPDYKTTQADVWGAGDWIFASTVGSGTHKGDMGPIKATDKPVTIHYFDVCRTEGGKLAECWGYMNNAELLTQIGAMPGPEAVAQK
jgi:predicted ester cyclase